MASLPPEPPRRGQDMLAVAVFGIAIVLLAGMLLYVFLLKPAKPPEPTASGSTLTSDLLARFDGLVAMVMRELEQKPVQLPKPAPVQKPPQTAKPPAAAKPPPPVKPAPEPSPSAAAPPAIQPAPRSSQTPGIAVPARWRYKVTMDPPVFRDAELIYTTTLAKDGPAVRMEFIHAGGKNAWDLGLFAPNLPSNARLRFPGFFLHSAHFVYPMFEGQSFAWEYPWQLPDGNVRPDRVRRFNARVAGFEPVSVPAGKYDAMRIDVSLEYLDAGKVHARAKETLWFSLQVIQLVKVVREGRTPDEPAHLEMVELAEYKFR